MAKDKTKSTAAKPPKPKKMATATAQAGAPPKLQTGRDWSETLFLPKTDFPMKAGLPEREPQLIERWNELGLYERLRKEGRGREKFILHDGPPYANGNLHIGHALNKILKDVINRSQTMMGKDAAYVPGWDCHGLPIEWKVEEDFRARGKNKDDVPILEFREMCRQFAARWIDVQREEFRRLGVEGDWRHPYTTMSFDAEAVIARELMNFAMNGTLYRGSKPVMWSVVERTALAEAEVEYEEIESPAIYVKFPVSSVMVHDDSANLPRSLADSKGLEDAGLDKLAIVIWTTTPWTIPGNRAIAFSHSASYGRFRVTAAPEDNWVKPGEQLVVADSLAENLRASARIEAWIREADFHPSGVLVCAHPLRDRGYEFQVPLLAGEHVTEDTGTGFVHTAPGHGTEDFEVWEENRASLKARGIDTTIPFTVDAAGYFTKEAPGFEGKRVIDDKGRFGDANEAVIKALQEAGMLVARTRHRHDYPHSWRSKKPVIFRATPQWFIAMDKPIGPHPEEGASSSPLPGGERSEPSLAKAPGEKAQSPHMSESPHPTRAASTSPPRGEVKFGEAGASSSPLPGGERSEPSLAKAPGEGAHISHTLETPHPTRAASTSPQRGEVKFGVTGASSSPLPSGERSGPSLAKAPGEGAQTSHAAEPPHPTRAASTSPQRGEVKSATLPGDTLRARALKAIGETQWVPPQGENRIRGMIETRPDWVVSRQRAWGVPITVFRHKDTGEVIPSATHPKSAELIERIIEAFAAEGADAWFKPGAKERFLDGIVNDPAEWEKVDDILDVWFDSGSTHAFVLEERPDLKWPASLYLEGSDQHRGWFQSSLLEACGTRGRAPYDAVLTHGFVLAEDGRKMSKSLGNVVAPQDVIRQSGAEILRLWAMSSDYEDDLRIGPEIVKANVESYRKLRNTLRFLLGNLAHYRPHLAVSRAEMPELERYMLHRLAELDRTVRAGYDSFDFKRALHALFNFCVNDLSAFYFDIRKDALYCDPYDSVTRRAALTVLDAIFSALTAWLAPMLCFTMEEAWLNRFPDEKGSVHLREFPAIPAEWRDEALAAKWQKIRAVRRVVTGALEIERRERRIGSSLEAAPEVFIDNDDLRAALGGVDLAEIAITSFIEISEGAGPANVFRLDEVPGVAVLFKKAEGGKCARSWKILADVGADPEFPDLSLRDAEAVRQFDALKLAAE